MAVTSDNKLLLCNYLSSHRKVYIYKDYKTYEISFTSSPCRITVVPCTDKAVVTPPSVVISLTQDPSVFKIKTLSIPPM
jgi:hypothetical protein